MKGRSLISIFLFLILFICPVIADESGEFVTQGSTNYENTGSATPCEDQASGIDHIWLKDASIYTNGLQDLDVIIPAARWGGLSHTVQTSAFENIELKTLGGTKIADGKIGYAYSSAADAYWLWVWFDQDTWVSPSSSGDTYWKISGHTPAHYKIAAGEGRDVDQQTGTVSHSIQLVDYVAGSVYIGIPNVEWDSRSYFYFNNKYILTTIQANYHILNYTKVVSGVEYVSKVNVTDNVGHTYIDEPSINGDNFIIQFSDPSTSFIELRVYDANDNYYFQKINIGSITGEINFNQSFYTDPENIEVEWDITGFDSESYTYMIQMAATLDGDVHGDFSEAVGSWNTSTYVSSASGAAVFDLSSEWYDELPIWIRGELWAKEKATGISTRLDLTPAAIYHEKTYVSQTGTIVFNKTFFIEYEDIEVEWDIDDYDADQYVYEIQITTSVSGVFSQDSFPADGNWNVTPFISSASGTALFDFYSDGYKLPIWLQGELWAQHKATGAWMIVDRTPGVGYLQKSDFGVGSIWTEKSTYNLSEMFYIFVETDYPIVEVELISDTYHDIQSLEVFEGGWQRVGYAFFSPHNFTAYLYEDGVITNQTSFSVWATSPMLNIFLDSEALKTQFAFEFYTNNSSDTITGYKPDGSIFYGPITDLETGDRNIIKGVSSSSPPGIYTISLFHDGTTYYNDTIELYSTSEWVYFEASKYETGDRIKIYSYVTDSRQQVRLTDSIGTAVITWTDSAGYIIPNRQTILYFSLTDNNEYGMNVNTSIDAGTFRTGNWKVEIIGIDGKLLTNESTYDYTTVSKRIESPADTSDEMIDIFFSPEGAFMLFTVCLTMMGLAVAKHPAGGGAGATVGTGFGVYFNVLPPWMLMLAVITLVVLAGVSIAVYFKGK